MLAKMITKCKRNGLKSMALCLAVVMMLAGALSPVRAEAASAKWKKACKAYNTWLRKNPSKFKDNGDISKRNRKNYKKTDSFILADLDRDGVPELIASHPMSWKWSEIYVYTYKSGKVVQIKGVDGKKGKAAAISANSQANGFYEVYRCKQKHLHVAYSGGMESFENTYTISKGKLKLYAKSREMGLFGENKEYMLNGKKSSNKKYQAVIKKCSTENYKVRKHLVRNTKTNRSKYLK